MSLFRNRIAFLMALSRIRNIVVYGVPPLSLNNAVAGSLGELKAYGGTYEGVPTGYTPYNYIASASAQTRVPTDIIADVDDMEYEIRLSSITASSWYIFQSRESGTGRPIYGVSGASSGTITFNVTGTYASLTSGITRTAGHEMYIRAKHSNGKASLYVEDLTAGTSDLKTATYTSSSFTPAPSTPTIGIFGNGTNYVGMGNQVVFARIRKGGKLVLDCVPAVKDANTRGFYDRISHTLLTASVGSLTAGSVQYPAPTAPADIICNNGALRPRLPLEYTELEYITGDGNAYIDLNTTLTQNDNVEVDFIAQYSNASQIFGYRDSATSNNFTLFHGSGLRSLFMDFNNSDYTNYRLGTDCDNGTEYIAKISKTARQLCSANGTVLAQNNTVCPDTFTTGNAYLFFVGGAPSSSNKSKDSIKYVKISDRMYLVPAKRNSDSEIGMYDMVSGTFFTNAGTGAFTAGGIKQTVVPDGNTETLSIWQVPAGYKQLEYIEGTGTQYIDTGVTPTTATEVNLVGQLTNDTTTAQNFFGSRNTSSATTGSWNLFYNISSSKQIRPDWATTQSYSFSKNTDFDIVLSCNNNNIGVFEINGVQPFLPSGTAKENGLYNLVLFGCNSAGTISGAPLMLKSCSIKETGVLVRNFIPALETATGDVGMYDTVTGTFFTNSGTGDFIAGPLANTVVCEPLFGGEPYGSDPDEQNILTGEVKRWYKIMVLDGSENWSGDANDDPLDDGWILNVSDYNVPASQDVRFWCTHFFHIAIFPASNPEGRCCGYATNKLWFGAAQMCPTLAGWKAWLKQQSETRNPVVIVYYSANSSTEQVAAQSINVEAGSNTLDFVETAITDLKVRATYTRE